MNHSTKSVRQYLLTSYIPLGHLRRMYDNGLFYFSTLYSRTPINTHNTCILCGREENVEHVLQFCTGMTAQMASVKSYKNADNVYIL